MKRSIEIAGAVALLSAAMTAPAYAYLDPGSVSMALQVAVWAVASGLVLCKMYLSRIARFFRRTISPSAEVNGSTGDTGTR
jgi:hypothetical protein